MTCALDTFLQITALIRVSASGISSWTYPPLLLLLKHLVPPKRLSCFQPGLQHRFAAIASPLKPSPPLVPLSRKPPSPPPPKALPQIDSLPQRLLSPRLRYKVFNTSRSRLSFRAGHFFPNRPSADNFLCSRQFPKAFFRYK